MAWYLIVVCCAAAALALLLLYASLRSALALTRPIRHPDGRARSYDGALFGDCFRDYDQVWDRTPFTLDVGDAVLSGEYIVHPQGRDRVVIVSHGHTINRFASVKYAHIFYQLGWSILLYDQRYFGHSTGRCCTLGQRETDDLVKVMAYARGVFGRDCLIGLHGESMGGATVLNVLSRETPAFVVADCPFADTETLLRYLLPYRTHLPNFPVLPLTRLMGRLLFGYDFRKVSPQRAVAAAQVPICLIHGDGDRLIPCSHSQALYAACRDPRSELHLVPGAHHAMSFAADRQAYEDVMTAFVTKCIEKEKPI